MHPFCGFFVESSLCYVTSAAYLSKKLSTCDFLVKHSNKLSTCLTCSVHLSKITNFCDVFCISIYQVINLFDKFQGTGNLKGDCVLCLSCAATRRPICCYSPQDSSHTLHCNENLRSHHGTVLNNT